MSKGTYEHNARAGEGVQVLMLNRLLMIGE